MTENQNLSNKVIYTDNGSQFTIDRPLGAGIQGQVYSLLESNDKVVKIFQSVNRSVFKRIKQQIKLQPVLKQKLAEIISENFKSDQSKNSGLYGVAWPISFVYDENDEFIGYLSHRFEAQNISDFFDINKLHSIPNFSFENLTSFWERAFLYVHALHECYIIIGDVNGGNLLMDPRSFIPFIVDTDSHSLPYKFTRMHAFVRGKGNSPRDLIQLSYPTKESDIFGLTILMLQTFFGGRHPFMVTNDAGEVPDQDMWVKRNIFPYCCNGDYAPLSGEQADFHVHIWQALPNIFRKMCCCILDNKFSNKRLSSCMQIVQYLRQARLEMN